MRRSSVTGFQTCALPLSAPLTFGPKCSLLDSCLHEGRNRAVSTLARTLAVLAVCLLTAGSAQSQKAAAKSEISRASCRKVVRERSEVRGAEQWTPGVRVQ